MVVAARTVGVAMVVTGVIVIGMVVAGPIVSMIITVRHEEPLGCPQGRVNEAVM
ncbi:hypothetical protein GCM10007859_20870 [Brevundimonas denitrificans]|uniref:Uncharacterized protein n=1 Tax=Brevundimonas denitrificans TaxID=1443434 RepID=A0ABQ6BKT0_9CAUL|nr:hypothetical protein GCM10007859_20870 [Brevundimonas denitrificans]